LLDVWIAIIEISDVIVALADFVTCICPDINKRDAQTLRLCGVFIQFATAIKKIVNAII